MSRGDCVAVIGVMDSKENDATSHVAHVDITVVSQGAVGPIGPMGPQGPPVSFKSAWNGATSYAVGNAVSEGGSSYVALMASTGIDPATDEPLWQRLVDMQYRDRELTYRAAYPEAFNWILCVSEADREAHPVGRLLVDHGLGCRRIINLAVLIPYRGRGLGSWALKQCQVECAAAGADLELEVAPNNPARRLYVRLGFRAVSEDFTSVRMAWRPLAT